MPMCQIKQFGSRSKCIKTKIVKLRLFMMIINDIL